MVVMQLTIEDAIARRDDGIQRAARNAGQAWNSRARGYLLEYLSNVRAPFLAEDVRVFAERGGLASPPDARAWGGVIRGAALAGFIHKIGYAPAKSSNCSPKCQWKAA